MLGRTTMALCWLLRIRGAGAYRCALPPAIPRRKPTPFSCQRILAAGTLAAATARRSVVSRSKKVAYDEVNGNSGDVGSSLRTAAALDEPTTVALEDGYRQSLASVSSHFVTPPQRVYIEDTDAYGVMYNGNYLRAYDRALHMHLASPDKEGCTGGDEWSIVAVEELAFKAPPPLGGVFCIEGTLRQPLPGGGTTDLSTQSEEVWDMVMRSPDGSTVYNTAAGITIVRPADRDGGEPWLPTPPPLIPAASGTVTTTRSTERYRSHRDEFEAHHHHLLPLRSALNFMERSRTDKIGGPDALRRLQHEPGEGGGVLYVVTRVRHCSLVGQPPSSTGCRPGTVLQVATDFAFRNNRGTIVDCYHTLMYPDGSRHSQGVVTIVALDAATRRPTRKIPAWLSEALLGLPPPSPSA